MYGFKTILPVIISEMHTETTSLRDNMRNITSDMKAESRELSKGISLNKANIEGK